MNTESIKNYKPITHPLDLKKEVDNLSNILLEKINILKEKNNREIYDFIIKEYLTFNIKSWSHLSTIINYYSEIEDYLDIINTVITDELKQKFINWNNKRYKRSQNVDSVTNLDPYIHGMIYNYNAENTIYSLIVDDDGMPESMDQKEYHRYQTVFIMEEFSDEFYYAFEATEKEIKESEFTEKQLFYIRLLGVKLMENDVKSFKVDW